MSANAKQVASCFVHVKAACEKVEKLVASNSTMRKRAMKGTSLRDESEREDPEIGGGKSNNDALRER